MTQNKYTQKIKKLGRDKKNFQEKKKTYIDLYIRA